MLNKKTVYEIITEQIINSLEQDRIPWRKPWSDFGSPKNLLTGKEYSGINFFLLSLSGWQNPYFLTYKQAKKLGGNIKKGEKQNAICWYSPIVKKDKSTGEEKSFKCLRYYGVFNVEQTENIPLDKIPDLKKPDNFSPIEQAENIILGYQKKPEIVYSNQGAFYSPSKDLVNLPEKNTYDKPESFYATAFHELTHSTGHKKRLDREGITNSDGFGNHLYSKEELIAEMGSAFLCSKSGIDNTLENSKSYIQNWLRVLRGNSKMVIEASTKAKQASEHILNIG